MKLLEIIEVDDTLGESPLWDARTGLLYWIDIAGERLGVLDVAGGLWTTWPAGRRPGSIALTTTPGTLLVAGADGIRTAVVDLAGCSHGDVLADPEHDIDGNRFNDGKTDRVGRFWAGTMDDAEMGHRTGSMYCLDPDFGIERRWGDVGIPNGLCFSPDGIVMYSADSMDATLWRAVYDHETGRPQPRQVFATTAPPAVPDGSTVDVTGAVWNAEWDGSRLVRYTPDGAVDRIVDLPVTRPTCPAFGGEAMDLLFVTSAQIGGRQLPADGALLVYESDVAGVPEVPYRLRA